MANPGSPEAMRLGCKCSPLSNNYGKGAVVGDKIEEGVFDLADDCPIHVDARRVDADTLKQINNSGREEISNQLGDGSVDSSPGGVV